MQDTQSTLVATPTGSLNRQGQDTMPGRLTDKPNQHPSKGPVNKVTGHYSPLHEEPANLNEIEWDVIPQCAEVPPL